MPSTSPWSVWQRPPTAVATGSMRRMVDLHVRERTFLRIHRPSHLNKPVVGMAPTSNGRGYWMVASDGGIFAFGDAAFEGSMGSPHLNRPVVAMAATQDGKGYWLVASTEDLRLRRRSIRRIARVEPAPSPIVNMTPTPDNNGYWLVSKDGTVYGFGDAGHDGSTEGVVVSRHFPDGYARRWLFDLDGRWCRASVRRCEGLRFLGYIGLGHHVWDSRCLAE